MHAGRRPLPTPLFISHSPFSLLSLYLSLIAMWSAHIYVWSHFIPLYPHPSTAAMNLFTHGRSQPVSGNFASQSVCQPFACWSICVSICCVLVHLSEPFYGQRLASPPSAHFQMHLHAKRRGDKIWGHKTCTVGSQTDLPLTEELHNTAKNCTCIYTKDPCIRLTIP